MKNIKNYKLFLEKEEEIKINIDDEIIEKFAKKIPKSNNLESKKKIIKAFSKVNKDKLIEIRDLLGLSKDETSL
jgi:hypothetical protein